MKRIYYIWTLSGKSVVITNEFKSVKLESSPKIITEKVQLVLN